MSAAQPIILVYQEPDDLVENESGEFEREFDGLDFDDNELSAIHSMMSEALAEGFLLGPRDAYCAWRAYSDSLCAGWLMNESFLRARPYLKSLGQ